MTLPLNIQRDLELTISPVRTVGREVSPPKIDVYQARDKAPSVQITRGTHGGAIYWSALRDPKKPIQFPPFEPLGEKKARKHRCLSRHVQSRRVCKSLTGRTEGQFHYDDPVETANERELTNQIQ